MTALADADSVDKGIEILDGTSKIGEGEDKNPALDEDIIQIDEKDEKDEMPEIELKNIDEGEADEDEEDSDTDIDDDSQEDMDEDEDDQKGEEPKYVEIDNKEYAESQEELQQLTKQMGYINKRYTAIKKPEPPKADEYGEVNESEQRKYEIRLTAWEDRQQDLTAETEVLRETIRDAAAKQEKVFRKNHKNEDLNDFENFVRDRQHYYIAYLSGDSTLEELYDVYQRRYGKVKKAAKKAEKLNKAGVKIKRVDTKGKGVSNYGGNGIPSKFKYANMPEFKDMVKDMKKRKRGIDGRPFTNERIEKLCKQDYQISRGISIT